MTEELKPCPFCNGPACKIVANAFPPYGAAPLSDSYGDDGLDVDAYVYCHECGARGPEVEETIFNAAEYAEAEASAVRRWNISTMRSEIERQGELIELYQDQFEELHVARNMLSRLSAAGFSMGNDLIESIVAMRMEFENLQAKLKRIEAIAECGSVQSWLALSDEEKAKWFGLHVEHDSERIKFRADALAMRDLLAECAEYLGTNTLTSIAHGSILHRKMIDATKVGRQ